MVIDPDTRAGAYKISGAGNIGGIEIGFSLDGLFINKANANNYDRLGKVSNANDILGIITSCINQADLTKVITSIVLLFVIVILISFLATLFGAIVAGSIGIITRAAFSKSIQSKAALLFGFTAGGGLLNGTKNNLCG